MMDFESAAVPYLPIRRRKLIRRRLTVGALLIIALSATLALRHHQAVEPMGERVFNDVTSTLAMRYYDGSFHGLDWPAIVTYYRPRVIAAPTERERYQLLSEMLARLGDSHTAVFSPTDVSQVQDEVAQALGAAFVTLGHDRVVLRVAPQSPAATAGLRPGLIVADVPYGATSRARRFAVRDPLSGRTWNASVRLNGSGSFDALSSSTVDWGVVNRRIAYLRMASFPNDINEELGWAISAIGSHEGLILDLRGNPGGLIDAVDATAGIFLPNGSLVATGAGRFQFFGRRRFVATGDARAHYYGRLVVLVDEHSESGAEALASALQSYRRAVIIGQPTARHVLGVEVEQTLPDGGLLRVATLDMRDAQGDVLEGRGVTPDIIVPRTPADVARGHDPQLRAAIALLNPKRS